MAESYLNESRQYNNLNQLTEIDTNPQSYGYPVFMRSHFSATANNGQVMSVDDARQNGANIVYTYDALKRLTNATTAAWTQTIGYDGFGNITSKTVPPTSAEPAFPGAVSAKNWLAGVSYDLNGNALAVNAFALTYDVENRLATATSGTAVESYLYDESNHRVEKTIGSSDYLYFYGPDGRLLTILQLWAGTTSLVANRMYFGGLLLGSAGPGVWNDVSTMTDRLGTAVTGYPYGTDIGSTSASNDQPDFATYTKDATTGFEYANQRYYSAGLGRFLSVDTSGVRARLINPTGWNLFTYSLGDAVNFNDPSGSIALPGLGSGCYLGLGDPFDDDEDAGADCFPFIFPVVGLDLSEAFASADSSAARSSARSDLERPKCYALLGFGTAQLAQAWFDNSITFHYGADGKLVTKNGDPYFHNTPAPADTAQAGQININTDYNWGDFSKVTTSTGDAYNYLLYWNSALGTRMTSDQFGALIIIHELLHNRPGDAQHTVGAYQTIYRDCISGGI